LLVAEKDHKVLGARAVQLVDLAVAERLRQVDPVDLGADDRRQFLDRNCIVRPRVIGGVFDPRSVAAA